MVILRLPKSTRVYQSSKYAAFGSAPCPPHAVPLAPGVRHRPRAVRTRGTPPSCVAQRIPMRARRAPRWRARCRTHRHDDLPRHRVDQSNRTSRQRRVQSLPELRPWPGSRHRAQQPPAAIRKTGSRRRKPVAKARPVTTAWRVSTPT